MKKFFCLLFACLMLAGCTPQKETETATFLDVFDTVTTIKGDGADEIHAQLQTYHKLFDIYNDYAGLNNLKTVNDNAGIAPVKVDDAIIELLTDCIDYYNLTGGKVNVCMGSVLKLWHRAREDSLAHPEKAYIPTDDELSEAAKHTDIARLIIDEEKSTVYLADRSMSLDVGAIAKGWAGQKVMETAPAGMLISLGGNVVATGPKPDDTPWTVGVQDPGGDDVLEKIPLSYGAVVTSGDYQRIFTVDGKDYPHIIHPETGMPGMLWSGVTVICEDSALADALSTALFLMPYEEGKVLAGKCGAEAIWIDKAGNRYQ